MLLAFRISVYLSITELLALLMCSRKKRNHMCTLLQQLEMLTENESKSFRSIKNCGRVPVFWKKKTFFGELL